MLSLSYGYTVIMRRTQVNVVIVVWLHCQYEGGSGKCCHCRMAIMSL